MLFLSNNRKCIYGFKVTNNERRAIAYYIQEVIDETNDYWTTNLKKRSFIDRLVKNLHLLHIQS